MKNKIMNILVHALNYAKGMKNISERVIGEKEDVVTNGDIEIGDLMIRELLNQSAKVIVESEEDGKNKNFDDGEEDYYIAIDDIDGTNNMRIGKDLLPYGSIIVVFDGKNKSRRKL